VKVAIDGVNSNLDALIDSRSHIRLIQIPLYRMQAGHRIAICRAFGAKVQRDVALLSIKHAVSENNKVNIAPPLEVGWLVGCLTARQHRKVNLCQLRVKETGSVS